nr:hypothetical protein [Ktedonobacterales bacterium]
TATNPGGPPTACSGSGNGISYTLTPCPQVHGTLGTITVVAPPQYAGASVRILLVLNQAGTCTNNDCGFDRILPLDSNSTVSTSYTIPADAVNPDPIGGSINVSGGPQTNILVTTPVR